MIHQHRYSESALPITVERIVPQSYGQQKLWLFEQLYPGITAHHLAYSYELIGELQTEALEKSFREIICRHEVLRTTFSLRHGIPHQIVSSVTNFSLPLSDLSSLPKTEQDAEVKRLVHKETQKPFDLSQSPPMRIRIIRLDNKTHILVIILHYLISDGWGLGILGRELGEFYNAIVNGKKPSLQDLPKQYSDFSIWHHELIKRSSMERQLRYWKHQLDDLVAFDFPADHPRPTIRTFKSELEYVNLPKNLSDKLKSLSQRQGVTLFMTTLAAFKTLLSRYTGKFDIPIITPLAGRHRGDVENLIGYFINPVVLRADFSYNPTFNELLQQVRKVTLGAMMNQDIPYGMILDVFNPKSTRGSNYVFSEVLFGLQTASLKEIVIPGLSVTMREIPKGSSKYEIYLALIDNPDGLNGTIEYDSEIFERKTIKKVLNDYQQLLELIVDSPDKPLSRLILGIEGAL